MKHLWIILFAIIMTNPLMAQMQQQTAQTPELASSKVDFETFMEMSEEAYKHREKRMVEFKKFLRLMQQEGTILLDTRSTEAYNRKHIKGAVHINFSDFTAKKLAKVIPAKTTTVLIYCNNNFDGDEANFAEKAAPLALNIPTFINLYGYGYKNIYELSSLLPINYEQLVFAGSEVK